MARHGSRQGKRTASPHFAVAATSVELGNLGNLGNRGNLGHLRHLGLALGLAVGLVACDKGDKGAAPAPAAGNAPAGGGTAAPAPAPAPGGTPGTAPAPAPAPTATAPASGGDWASILPAQATIIVGIAPSQLKNSKHFVQLTNMIPPEAQTVLADIKATCGLDYQTDLTQIVVAMVGTGGKQEPFVFLRGNFDKAKVQDCVGKIAPKYGDKKTVTFTDEGKLTKVQPQGEEAKYMAWVANDTILIPPDGRSVDAINTMLASGTGIANNAELADIYGKTNKSGTIWFSIKGNPSPDAAPMDVAGRKVEIKGMYGTITLTNSLDAQIAVRTPSAEDAAAVAAEAAKQMEQQKAQNPQVAALAKDITVKAEGNEVHARVKLDEATLDQMAAMIPMLAQVAAGSLGGGGFGPAGGGTAPPVEKPADPAATP